MEINDMYYYYKATVSKLQQTFYQLYENLLTIRFWEHCLECPNYAGIPCILTLLFYTIFYIYLIVNDV